MKPQTKRAKRVAELCERLPELTAKQREWAKTKLFSRNIYAYGGRAWCSECGRDWASEPQVWNVEVECPKCGTTLTRIKSRKTVVKEESYYFTKLDVIKEFQVVRHYMATRSARIGAPSQYRFTEVVQIWIDEDGNSVIRSRPRQAFTRYYDKWIESKPMGIRYRPSCGPDPYKIGAPIALGAKIAARVRRNGYTSRCTVDDPATLIVSLLKCRYVEILLKRRQYDLLRLFLWRGEKAYEKYAHAIRIAYKNRYTIREASVWCDYIDLLEYFGYDTHNAHYVCPKSLHIEHNRLSDRKAECERRERLRRRAERMSDESKAYKKRMGVALQLNLTLGNLEARPLQDVYEFYDEGEKMHHCVYSNEYYKRDDALIFTVRQANKRLATVEVDINALRVVQCRGNANSKPPRYNDIIQMFESAMPKIAKSVKRNQAI